MISAVDLVEDEREGLPSASGMDRRDSCPGSDQLIKQCPPPTPEAVTLAGQRIHDALEADDDSGLVPSEAEIAQALKRMENRAFADWSNRVDPDSLYEKQMFREERFYIRDRRNLTPIATARLDVGYICPPAGSALIINFKTGFLPTTPIERNWQERTEALALWHEYPDLTEIQVGIAQHRFKDFSDFVLYSREDLAHAERNLLYTLWHARQSGAPRYPGDWCRWCPAKAYCKEQAAWMAIDIPSPSQSIEEKIATLTPEHLRMVWDKRTIVESFLDSVKARLKAMPESTLRGLGLALRDGNSQKVIRQPPAAYDALKTIFTHDEILQCAKISVPALAKLLARQAGIPSKQATIEVLKALGDLVEVTKTESILERIS